MTNLFDWFRGNSALTFARPWLLLLLLAIPLLAWLRGKSGPAAALTYSSTASLRAIGRQSAARAGKILRALLLLTLTFFVVAGASSTRQKPHADRGERNRYHARAGRFGLDADE